MLAIKIFKKYRIQAGLDNNHHFHVDVSLREIDIHGEQFAVGHAAWLKLF